MRALVWTIAVGAIACGPVPRTPNFGSLRPFENRSFNVTHDIHLFSAKNGLEVALIPDARTNLVSVDVRYGVGAAEDPKGRAGLAHLVEHLLFTLRDAGGGPSLGDVLADVALTYNAYTTWDETHYTATALADQLPALLEVEARRLGATCEQLDEAVFVRERDVVLEEQAEREGDLTSLDGELRATVFGAAHPYARDVGSREIADATLDEACDFIAAHYAPDRAILVVTGAIDVDDASAVIGKQFGWLSRRATGQRAAIHAPSLDGDTSEHVADIEEAAALVFFERPAWGAADEVQYRLSAALVEAALSRMDSDAAWVTEASVFELGGMRASTMVARVSVEDDARLDDAVAAVFAAIAKVPEAAAVVLPIYQGRLRAKYAAGYDAFAGRGGWIADYLQYRTDNRFMLDDLGEIDLTTVDWITHYLEEHFVRSASHVAMVRPSGKKSEHVRATVASSTRDYDLAIWRPEEDVASASQALEVTTTRVATRVQELDLANGLHVLLAPDATSPVIDARVVFPVGTNADPIERRGLAALSAYLLDHDYEVKLSHDDLTRAEWALKLGTVMSSDVDETHTTFRAEGLGVFADWHVWRLAWLLDQGVYAADDLRGVQERVAAADEDPDHAARFLRARLFGSAHPYASPLSSLDGVAQITRADLTAFKRDHYTLRGATLIIAGGFDVDAMTAEITELFGWDGGDPAEIAPPPSPAPAKGPGYLAVHDASMNQVEVTIGFAAHSNPSAARAARLVLVGMIDDRVRAVREALGASYGVQVGYIGGTGGEAVVIAGAVDPQRATKAVELVVGALPDVAQDVSGFVRARRHALALVLADSCGASDLADELQALIESDQPLDGFDDLARQLATLTLDDVAEIARADLASSRMTVMARGAAGAVDEALAAVAGDAEVETYE